ncbi:MAG: flavin reductase family protein [Candidatus Kapaibacterium sp.]
MRKTFSREDILSMDKNYRVNFMNSVGGFKSANLIGTLSSAGRENLAVFNSVLHIGANPPFLGFISRPHTTERHTLENILDNGFFTINHINRDIYEQAHKTANRYPRDISEFEAVELHPEYIEGFEAPYVKESIIKIGLKLADKIDIKLNGTILVIGSVVKLILEEKLIAEDGYIDLHAADTVAVASLDAYHFSNKLKRLNYAKPDDSDV